MNREGFWQFTPEPSPGWQLLDPGRRRAEADERPLGAVELLVRHNLAELQPEGRVLGRPCTSFRVREPIGSLATRPPTGRDYVELCVDRTGVVLRERWVSNGRLVRGRDATRFDPVRTLAPDTFTPDLRVDEGKPQLRGGRRAFPLTHEIEAMLDIGFDLPDGIEADGGVAALHVDPFGQPIGGTVFRFYRRGDDLIDVEEVESDAVHTEGAIRYDVPGGRGFVETNLRTVTLKVVLPRGITVVMRAPSLELLDAMAAAIEVR